MSKIDDNDHIFFCILHIMAHLAFSELYNRYNSALEHSRKKLSDSIDSILYPNFAYPKVPDATIQELYDAWRADAQALDVALNMKWYPDATNPLRIPLSDDMQYDACRHMMAVNIERNIYSENSASSHLKLAVERVRNNINTCAFHPVTCPCHEKDGWTNEENNKLLANLNDELEYSLAMQITGGHSVGAFGKHDTTTCSCGACKIIRVMNKKPGTFAENLGSGEKALKSIEIAKKMMGGDTDEGFVKNLFQTVQGVKYDSKCPHDMPFYACMSCSH